MKVLVLEKVVQVWVEALDKVVEALDKTVEVWDNKFVEVVRTVVGLEHIHLLTRRHLGYF